MGFKDIKRQVIECLKNGNIQHEPRDNTIDIKNLLAIGAVTPDDVVNILKRSRGDEHESSPHHYDKQILVHIVKTTYEVQEWYIKWYFVDPDCVFISVHH